MSLISTRQLGKNYSGVQAISALDLEVERGRPLGVVGPNGAGKTTLFSLLAGFIRPDAGELLVLGQTPGESALRGRLAILPQDANFLRGQRLASQLRLLARLQGMAGRQAAAEVERVLEFVELGELASRSPHTFSHGQQKRALIAQALIGEPELILLDEPTAGLDPASVQSIRKLVRRMENDVTFLISSHNLDEIQDLCGSVVVLEKGRLVTHREMDELVQRSRKLSFRLAEEPGPGMTTLFDALAGIEQVETGAPGERLLVIHYAEDKGKELEIEIMRVLSGAGIDFVEMSRGDSLSRRFSELTGNQ